jgi:branched-chain amino acid aminotransferase
MTTQPVTTATPTQLPAAAHVAATRFVSFDGRIVPYGDARMHVLSPALKYGIGVFEGFCAFWNPERGQLYSFRMQDHLRRLRASLDMAGLELHRDTATLEEDVHEVVRANDLRQDIHMRLAVFLAADDGTPEDTGPCLVSIVPVAVSRYFGKPTLDLGVSSWARIPDRAMPPRMKSIANYHNGRQASIEAKRNGYDAPLMLNEAGRIAEGFGYNVFLVRDGRLVTPAVTESILEGITRDSVLRLAREHLRLAVEERPVDRTEIYSADEMFVCGSAANITPVSSVDRHRFGDGTPGPVTAALSEAYLATARGELLAEWAWTSPVHP